VTGEHHLYRVARGEAQDEVGGDLGSDEVLLNGVARALGNGAGHFLDGVGEEGGWGKEGEGVHGAPV
jgi:hypothetical protein